MKKRFSRERLSYWFDCLMSRGTIAMIVLLFIATFAVVGIIGVIAFLVGDEGGLVYQLWMSLMHTLDAGTLAGNSIDNVPYVIMMSLATLCGLFLTSILIGVIATGIENKLDDLRKGISTVQEQGHTTIIGFNDSIYALLSEIIKSNSNHKKACVVVLGECGKEEMEEAIASHIPNTYTTRIICRSGSLHQPHSLERCAVEKSRSVIINVHDDAETIRILLALAAYLKNKDLAYTDMHFVAAIQNSQCVEAARIAGEGRAEIIYAKDAIARIIANTCRQHGLSQVLSELFNFDGDELYLEDVAAMSGKTIREAIHCFSNATVVGLYSNGQACLNPPMDTVIQDNDKIVLLEPDDGSYILCPAPPLDEALICKNNNYVKTEGDHIVILGSNDKLPTILEEYNYYVSPGTRVVIVDNDLSEEYVSTYENLEITNCTRPVTRNLLCEILKDDVNNVLLLNDDSEDGERSDARTLLQLILLRDIADTMGRHFAITTEMRNVDNQRLASQARVDDFVIGSDFACLMMTQISENRMLSPLINDLLDEDGSELYMKPVVNYVRTGQPVDFYTLTESAARRGEVFLGYRLMGKESSDVVINPKKDETIIFGEDDLIVVIAEN